MTGPAVASTSDRERFEAHYLAWRQARFDTILSYYGAAFFSGVRVLELGCGYADLGGALSELGADVTCTDGRPEHLAVAQARWPGIATVCADLDHEWPFDHYDLILHLGLLYHLEPTHRSLRAACRSCTRLVLETEVCDSADPQLVTTREEDGYDQALSGLGCRPSAARVERTLAEERMAFERLADGRCNAGMHVYDWPLRQTGAAPDGQRRLWFAEAA